MTEKKMKKIGRLIVALEMNRQLTVKKLLQKFNPAQTEKGLLTKKEDLIDFSNYLHEKIAGGDKQTKEFIKNNFIRLPLFTVEEMENWENERNVRVAELFEGLFWQYPQESETTIAARELGSKTSEAKKKSSAENGKKGGRPKKLTDSEENT